MLLTLNAFESGWVSFLFVFVFGRRDNAYILSHNMTDLEISLKTDLL